MRIWVTRTAPEAEATAERLRGLGHAPLVGPVLRLEPHAAPPDLQGAGALAFTSRNGVRTFSSLSGERALPAFTVGAATAQAAREAGFAEVHSAEGDVEALAVLIGAHRGRLAGPVVHAGPDEPAGDLVGALAAAGVEARLGAVYRTFPCELGPAVAAALASDPLELEAVLVHSPRAGRRLGEIAAVAAVADRLQAFCISAAAAEALAGADFGGVAVAPLPNETSLLSLLHSA